MMVGTQKMLREGPPSLSLREIVGGMERYKKHSWRDRPRPGPGFKVRERGLMAVTLFWALGGVWWQDKKGYRARCWSPNKAALLVLQELLGGAGKVSYRPLKGGRGYWQWNGWRKATVEWLDRNMTALFLPP